MAENAVTCPVCGIEEVFDADGARPPPLHEIGEFHCENDACQARVVFGKIMPRIVVEPYRDERGFRWTRLRIQDPKTKEDISVSDLDPKMTVLLTKNLLVMVSP